MVLEGDLAELMVKVDPELYRPYITKNSRGKPLLYARVEKALYGLLRSALLFYRKLVGELKAYGFVINPYDHDQRISNDRRVACGRPHGIPRRRL